MAADYTLLFFDIEKRAWSFTLGLGKWRVWRITTYTNEVEENTLKYGSQNVYP